MSEKNLGSDTQIENANVARVWQNFLCRCYLFILFDFSSVQCNRCQHKRHKGDVYYFVFHSKSNIEAFQLLLHSTLTIGGTHVYYNIDLKKKKN